MATSKEPYPDIKSLKLDWPAERVLRITLSRGKVNSMDWEMYQGLANIWRTIDMDPDVSAVIVTGSGKEFCAGGDFHDLEERMIHDYDFRNMIWKNNRNLVHNIIECNKPIITAINGVAVGGGMAMALLADISIIAKSARIIDGHMRLGVAAGDCGAMLWPLLCGMAKAKYFMLTNKPIYGEEAERIGLVSLCVEDDKLQETALEVATGIANGPPSATRWTKYTLNNWMRMAWPIFDTSAALETLGFTGPELREGLSAHIEKRTPRFDPKSSV